MASVPQGRWVSLLLMAAVCAFLFRGALIGGALFYRDVHLLWHGQIEDFVRCVAQGSWPLWDPWIGFGQPLLANANAQVYYPPTWLNLLMRPWTYYTLYAVAHLAFAGGGLYRLARALGVAAPGATVAALVWMGSGPLLSLVSMWNHYAGAAWMPWVLLASRHARRDPGLSTAAILGAALAAQMLAGSPDLSVYTGLVVAADVLLALWRRPGREVGRRILLAAGALGIGVALSAAQWMPTAEVARRSSRWSLPDNTRAYWSVHPLAAAELVAPGLWASPPPAVKRALFEGREPFLPSIYVGLPAFALVLAALIERPRGWRWAAALVVVALLLALGRHTPLNGLAASVMPLLRLSRFPVKVLPLLAVGWALLAGMGFEAWRGSVRLGPRHWAAVALTVAALAAGTIAGGAWVTRKHPSPDGAVRQAMPVNRATAALVGLAVAALAAARARGSWPRGTAAAAALLAVADLAVFHRELCATAPRELYTVRPKVVEALAGASRAFVYTLEQDMAARNLPPAERGRLGELVRIPAGWDAASARALGQQMMLASLTASRWGIRGSFAIDYLGLLPGPITDLTNLRLGVEGDAVQARLLAATGVSHVVAAHGRPVPGLVPVAEMEGLFRDPIRVYAVPSPLPRVLVVGQARKGAGAQALLDAAFDPRQEVLLESEPRVATAGAFQGSVRVVDDRPDRLEAETDVSRPGYLVVLDAYDPGWRARVDGRDAELLRANHAFRAVAVPAGRHRVLLVYRPLAAMAGLWISTASALALALAAAWTQRRAAPRPAAPTGEEGVALPSRGE